MLVVVNCNHVGSIRSQMFNGMLFKVPQQHRHWNKGSNNTDGLSVYSFILVWVWSKQWYDYVNQVRICSWNQPLLSNEGKYSCSMKQPVPLKGFELLPVDIV